MAISDRLLESAVVYAKAFSDCRKYKNCAVIITANGQTIFAVNHIPQGEDLSICARCPRMGRTSGVWDQDEECPVAHAEVTAIYKAARFGHSVEWGRMLTLYFPCMPCARAIVEAGIVEVHYRDKYDGPEFDRVAAYLTRAGVNVFKV